MTLAPYTNTYTDTDGTIADSTDIIAEFDRVSEFINAWAASYESIGLTQITTIPVIGDDTETQDIDPANGIIQTLIVDASIPELEINILSRAATDPYRVYVSVRFANKGTTFTVTPPSGSSHIFGVNKSVYTCSQVVNEGYYSAVLIVTYSSTGTHVQVYAANPETGAPELDDVLQVASL